MAVTNGKSVKVSVQLNWAAWRKAVLPSCRARPGLTAEPSTAGDSPAHALEPEQDITAPLALFPDRGPLSRLHFTALGLPSLKMNRFICGFTPAKCLRSGMPGPILTARK